MRGCKKKKHELLFFKEDSIVLRHVSLALTAQLICQQINHKYSSHNSDSQSGATRLNEDLVKMPRVVEKQHPCGLHTLHVH